MGERRGVGERQAVRQGERAAACGRLPPSSPLRPPPLLRGAARACISAVGVKSTEDFLCFSTLMASRKVLVMRPACAVGRRDARRFSRAGRAMGGETGERRAKASAEVAWRPGRKRRGRGAP